jgi:hypothetical protein
MKTFTAHYFSNETARPIDRQRIRENAQAALLSAMQVAFDRLRERGAVLTDPDMAEMDKQFRRVEKLFGYIPGSWARGS